MASGAKKNLKPFAASRDKTHAYQCGASAIDECLPPRSSPRAAQRHRFAVCELPPVDCVGAVRTNGTSDWGGPGGRVDSRGAGGCHGEERALGLVAAVVRGIGSSLPVGHAARRPRAAPPSRSAAARTRDLAPAHVPALWLVDGARSTAAGPDAGDFGLRLVPLCPDPRPGCVTPRPSWSSASQWSSWSAVVVGLVSRRRLRNPCADERSRAGWQGRHGVGVRR